MIDYETINTKKHTTPVEITNITYDLYDLVVAVSLEHKGQRCIIIFNSPRAFRCQNEGDLASYWENLNSTNGFCFEIKSGGWLSNSSKNELEITKNLNLKEYLIAGISECIQVIGTAPKLIYQE